ncbi:DUF262 domain-containing protein [Flavobacterium yafengii]|uniref:DUF262 domain-containing protein n=1 Tax=Flavobacterium yafengii TaxID=3041253 RepID=UPI0024A7ABFA|nr:DUF262 domain-containing HNH endonuclease family protein [Flavobacterium yafengii]MDI5897658.1 DUF262 domain-containing HNH endonuclease family protein [Flavobacterium yafengii]
MKVTPVYAAVGTFFKNDPMFRVPKYQRSYAWENSEIEDYLKDLENCFINQKKGTPVNHFFGGMVSVEKNVDGVVSQKEYELVDGQQRLATFVITISALISIYKDLLIVVTTNNEDENKRIINTRITKLTERFIEFEQEVHRNTKFVESLTLSKSDEYFFKDIIRQNNPIPTRESHFRIKNVYDKLVIKINDLIFSSTTTGDKIDDLEKFHTIIDDDFSIIHIVTQDTQEAYKLFQVLNDRGKSLTDGDLLRAKTLEILEGFHTQQDSAEHLWDEILKDSSKVTDNYLRWIYASHQGNRAGSNTLFDDFLDKLFPEHKQTIDSTKANTVLSTIKEIKHEFEIARKISEGSWPFQTTDRFITSWDLNRLDLLIRELGFTVSLPILLASYKLGERKFSEIVQLLEKFLFRYKTIANEHIEAVVTIFHTNSVLIRTNPSTYDINSLVNDLRILQTARVNDTHFKNSLDTMSYKEGGGNKPLKYFLMSLEHYKRWYDNGATGTQVCLDKTRVYDFSSTTIEHVYPRNAKNIVINSTLEPIKNEIENLTFMGSKDNELGGNDDFTTKKSIFLASSVGLNNDIGNLSQWSVTELEARKNQLKNMACAIFKV